MDGVWLFCAALLGAVGCLVYFLGAYCIQIRSQKVYIPYKYF